MKKHTKESGFTLLELMLVVGVSALLLMGIIQVSDMWIKAMRAEQAGSHLEMVRRAADEFLHATDPTDLAAMNNTDITNDIRFTRFLPMGAQSLRNPLGLDVNVRFNIDAGLNEIFINTTGQPIANKMLSAAANAIGAYGGMISQIYNTTGTVEAISPYGTWGPPIVLPGEFQYAAGDVDANGGQLAVYFAVSGEEIPGPYLYRSEINSDPQFNTMGANLLMNNNSILGANDVQTITMNASADVTVGGNLSSETGTFRGNLTITEGNIDVQNGNANISGVTNVTGDVNVTGQALVDRLVSQTASTGSMTAQEIDVDTLDVATSSVIQVGNLSVAGTDSTGDIIVGGTLQGGNITASGATINGGILTEHVEVIGGGVTIEGNINLGGVGDIVGRNVGIDDCITVGGVNYGPTCP